MTPFGINVFDFGARGDGKTDDTAAIQKAINYAAERGGGRICFPYTKSGYRIASPGIEEYDGKPVRAQLVIPPGAHNIMLEGEMPCKLLYEYQVRPLDVWQGFTPTTFGSMGNVNTMLFSDWEAPEVHDPEERPWSIISAPEGTACADKFSLAHFSVHNLEFRVHLNKEKMYPTQSAANFKNISEINIADSQFCLNETVGDTILGKELQPNPCHTAGLILSARQNDNIVLRNVAVQGFRYGIVVGEHVAAEYLYIHNCEEGLVIPSSLHLSLFNHIVAQHNNKVVTTTRERLFGYDMLPCHIIINGIDCEGDHGTKPVVSQMTYGVYDPDGRLHGSLMWHKAFGEFEFKVLSGDNFTVTKMI